MTNNDVINPMFTNNTIDKKEKKDFLKVYFDNLKSIPNYDDSKFEFNNDFFNKLEFVFHYPAYQNNNLVSFKLDNTCKPIDMGITNDTLVMNYIYNNNGKKILLSSNGLSKTEFIDIMNIVEDVKQNNTNVSGGNNKKNKGGNNKKSNKRKNKQQRKNKSLKRKN